MSASRTRIWRFLCKFIQFGSKRQILFTIINEKNNQLNVTKMLNSPATIREIIEHKR